MLAQVPFDVPVLTGVERYPEAIDISSVMTTPVSVIDAEKIIGYDVNRLKTLLGV